MADDKTGVTKQDPSFVEIGATGLKQNEGIVSEELLPQLSGTQAVRVYKEMSENDPVISAMLFAFEMSARQADWFFEPPPSPTPQEIEATVFANSLIEDMSFTWQDTLSEALTVLPYGWSAAEIVYKIRGGPEDTDPKRLSKFSDGKIGWRKFAFRSQDTLEKWIMDENGGVLGMTQRAPPDFQSVDIPVEKLLLFRIGSNKNNPEGRSILRGAYRAWFFKKRIEELEGIGIERDLAGIPTAWIPLEYMSKDAEPNKKAVFEEFKRIVTQLRGDEMDGLVLPLGYTAGGQELFKFELMSTGGTRQHDTDQIIQRWDQRISQSVLADFIIVGHSAQGSFALSQQKTQTFLMAVTAILDTIAETINRHALPQLFAFNAFNVERLPRFTHSELEVRDIKDVSNFVLRLSTAGHDFTDPETDAHLRRLAGLPERDPESDPGSDQGDGIEDPMLSGGGNNGGGGNVRRSALSALLAAEDEDFVEQVARAVSVRNGGK